MLNSPDLRGLLELRESFLSLKLLKECRWLADPSRPTACTGTSRVADLLKLIRLRFARLDSTRDWVLKQLNQRANKDPLVDFDRSEETSGQSNQFARVVAEVKKVSNRCRRRKSDVYPRSSWICSEKLRLWPFEPAKEVTRSLPHTHAFQRQDPALSKVRGISRPVRLSERVISFPPSLIARRSTTAVAWFRYSVFSTASVCARIRKLSRSLGRLHS